MTKDDKARIAARAFYQDNRDDYESYEEALKEAHENMSEAFMDSVVRGFTRPRAGCRLLMNDEGHVISVRTKNDFLSPITQMTLEDGAKIEQAFDAAADKNDKGLSALVLLQQIGWRLV